MELPVGDLRVSEGLVGGFEWPESSSGVFFRKDEAIDEVLKKCSRFSFKTPSGFCRGAPIMCFLGNAMRLMLIRVKKSLKEEAKVLRSPSLMKKEAHEAAKIREKSTFAVAGMVVICW